MLFHLSRNVRKLVVSAVLALIGIATLLPVQVGLGQGTVSPWTEPLNFSQQPTTVSYAPRMICDAYENLHVFWLERDAKSATLFYRNDVGGQLSQPFDIVAADAILNFSITLDKNNVLHLLWVDRFPDGILYYSSAPLAYAWNARYWSKPTVLADGVSADVADFLVFEINSDDTGKLWVTYTDSDSESMSHTSNLITSTDHGETWSEPLPIYATNTPIPSLVKAVLGVDGSGRYHVIWNERSFDYAAWSRIGYRRSTDQGATWDIDEILADGDEWPGVNVPDLTIYGTDEIHLTWDQPQRMHKWSKDGGDTWTDPQLIVELGNAFGGVNELTKDSSGRIHAVAAVGEGVYHVPFNGTSWNPADIIDDRTGIDAHGQHITACQGNHLNVVFYDRFGPEELWYSTAEVDSPHIPQTDIPAPDASLLASIPNLQVNTFLPTPTPNGDAQAASVRPTPLPASLAQLQGAPSEMRPTIASIVATVVVLFLGFVIKKSRE